MKYVACGTMMLALTAGACATTKPPVAPAPQVRIEAPRIQPMREPEAPSPTGAHLLAQQPAEVQQAVARDRSNGRWPSYVTPGYVLVLFNPAVDPLVPYAPLRTTDIQRAPGKPSPM